jgi:hypothetical protein
MNLDHLLHEHRDECLLALGIGLSVARTMWRVVRERNYSRELLLREQQSRISSESEQLRQSIERQNEMLKLVLTAFASGEPPTLESLLSSAEQDWSLTSSKTPRVR